MNDKPPYDPRSIANLILDEAAKEEIALSNLPLQKILYFAHAKFLIDTKTPLLSGYFEAWKYGPVHPLVYQSFKAAGAEPIKFRAMRTDLLTGRVSEAQPPASAEIRAFAKTIVNDYGKISPGRLIEISHARNAPWHLIWNKRETLVAFANRIPDNVILENFKHHKVAVAPEPPYGDAREDTPPE